METLKGINGYNITSFEPLKVKTIPHLLPADPTKKDRKIHIVTRFHARADAYLHILGLYYMYATCQRVISSGGGRSIEVKRTDVVRRLRGALLSH